MKWPRRSWMLGAVLAGVGALAGHRLGIWYRTADEGAAKPTENTGYVDGAACIGCHRAIWETYRHTGMARSFPRPRADGPTGDFQKANTFYHPASDRHYRMYSQNGRYFQRRHQIGFDGRETNIVEKEIHFIVGSGTHARTYLHRAPDGRILELPVAWYAEKGGYWAMNPGYDQPNHHDFRREILHECVFCHTGYPEIPAGADRVGSAPRFPGRIPEGIDCQRCHGPGSAHLQASQTGDNEKIRATIVNPARLAPERQLEICMQCHLETTSAPLPHAILRLDRGAFSYRPGEPLGDYALHFDHASGVGRDDKFEIAHQAYRLRKSACFRESAGRLTCTTCHDPHKALRGEVAIQRYTAACRSCHTSAHRASENCLACHMPQRRTDDVVQVVMTDHFIQRKKPARDLLAPRQERDPSEAAAYRGPVVLYYPAKLPPTPESEVYLAVAQVKQFANLGEGIPRLRKALERYGPQPGEFYFELAEAYAKLGQSDEAIRFYEEAIRRSPAFAPAYAALGKSLSKSGQQARAAEVLRKALQASRDPLLRNDLGLVYLRQGKAAEAADVFRAALQIDPDYAEAHNNLGGALGQTGNQAAAETAYREAIRIQPDLASAHLNLANLLASRNDLPQAEYHYRKAIREDPSYAAAQYHYAVALARAERYEEARARFEGAVQADPALAEAHAGLGDMLALLGKAAQAIRHYERALGVNPHHAGAHLGLGMAMASQGRTSEAVPHLKAAAGSKEANVRGPAQEALRQLSETR